MHTLTDRSHSTLINGRYARIAPLGSGGEGAVYLARDELLQRDVAIKFLATDDGKSRALAEARALASISHPGIVAVHDVHDGEAPYVVLEYVPGRTLADVLLDHGPLESDRAMEIVRGVAEALAVAHALGVTHGDLKPSNVLIDGEGRPKIVDFGVAHRSRESAARIGVSDGWAAPEVTAGRAPDARSDVYTLGLLLLALVTGSMPPQAQNVPADVRALLTSALARRPGDRFPTAHAFAEAVSRQLAGITTLAPLRPPVTRLAARRRPVYVLTVALALLVLVAVGVVNAQRTTSGPAHIPVPWLVGLQAHAAISIAHSMHFRTSVRLHYSPSPAGIVVAESPGQGASALPNSRLELEVSRGPRPVRVPNVVGVDLQVALRALEHARLHPVVTYVDSVLSASNNVAAQSVGASRMVPPGTTVTLTIKRLPWYLSWL